VTTAAQFIPGTTNYTRYHHDSAQYKAGPEVVSIFQKLDPSSSWFYGGYINVSGIYHTEGMVKIGNDFYISSTEIGAMPVTEPAGQRKPGTGVAHRPFLNCGLNCSSILWEFNLDCFSGFSAKNLSPVLALKKFLGIGTV